MMDWIIKRKHCWNPCAKEVLAERWKSGMGPLWRSSWKNHL